jgi:polysaccharide biosynthesis/export protein
MRATVNRIQTARPLPADPYQGFRLSYFKVLTKTLQPAGWAAALLLALSAAPGQAQTSRPSVVPPPVAPVPAPSPAVTPAPNSVNPPTNPGVAPASSTPAATPSRTSVPRNQVTTTGYREEEYLLGPGDQIRVEIFDVPELNEANAQQTLLVDGSVNLPWVGKVQLQGLSLQAAASRLESAYAPYIRTPIINVSLLTARTLRVNVVGAVKRPGSYLISPQGQTNQTIQATGTAATGGSSVGNQWPTVTQALQQAGGIVQTANLREVQVSRPLPDGSQQLINVNLWELLRTGQLQQDIALRDRDTLIVPVSTALSSEEVLLNGSASFAPATIQVNVVGEVRAPGTVEVAPNTSLNQALLTAGGFDPRARRSRVELIRLNPDGTAERRTIPVDLAAGINEESNPSLREFDTIVVGRSGIAQTGDALDNIFRPLGNIFGIFNVFDDLFD